MAVERTVGGSSSQHPQIEARPVTNNISMMPVQQQVNFSLSHIGAGSSAIAAAASQAIAATQQVDRLHSQFFWRRLTVLFDNFADAAGQTYCQPEGQLRGD